MRLLWPVLCLVPANLFGGIVYHSIAPDKSNAIQAQNRILSVQASGSNTTESGCILYGDVTSPCPTVTGGDTVVPSQSHTATFGTLGINDAANLAITFDAVESSGNSILLNQLVLYVWNDLGSGPLFTASLNNPNQNFASTLNGNGKAEAIFVLDQTSIDALNTLNFGPTWIIGMGASLSNVSSGAETFYVSTLGTATNPEPVPEPTTWSLLAVGLGVTAYLKRRRTL